MKLTTTLKRKVVSTTTTTAPPPPQPPQPETTREVTVRSMTSQLEETPMGKVADAVKEAVWPFRGGGVQWVEMEGEETKGKGSAVVDEEEITNPRSIFEEIFDFGK